MRRCLHAFLIAVLLLAPTMNAARACWHLKNRRHCPSAYVVPACPPPHGWCDEVVVISDVTVSDGCCEVVECPPACCDDATVVAETEASPTPEAIAIPEIPSVVTEEPTPAPQPEPVADAVPDLQPIVGDTVTPASNDEPAAEPEPVAPPPPQSDVAPESPVAEAPAEPVSEPPPAIDPVTESPSTDPVVQEPVEPVSDPVVGEPPMEEAPEAPTASSAPQPEPAIEPEPPTEPAPAETETETETATPTPPAPEPVEPSAPETSPEPAVTPEPTPEPDVTPEPAPPPPPAPEPAPEEPNLFDDAGGEQSDPVVPADAGAEKSGENLFDDEPSAAVPPVDALPPATPTADDKLSDVFGDAPTDQPAGKGDSESLFDDEPAPSNELAPSDESPAPADEVMDEAPPSEPIEPAASDDPFAESVDPAPPAGDAKPAADDLFDTPASDPAPAVDAAAPGEPAPLPSGEDDFTASVEPRRRWIHASGATSLVATLVDVADDGTCLLDTQGQRLRVPLENLSRHDRDYVGAAAVRIAARRDAKERAIKSQAVKAPAATDTAGM